MTTASIVTHKTPPKQLEKALHCLKNSSVNKVFIIDNSPTDDLKAIANNVDNVEYFHVENKGYGAGHNIAINRSIELNADYHLVLNSDISWEGDILSKIEKFMDSNKDVGLLSPLTFYPNGDLQYTCRMLPSPADMFLRAFIPENWNRSRTRKYLLKDFNHSNSLNCPYLLGSFMFFRIDALKDVGLFDKRFFMYPEDIDITRRIHERWKTIYWPEVSIIHEHQQASKKSLKMFWIHFFNMVKYFNKWGWFSDNKRIKYNKNLRQRLG